MWIIILSRSLATHIQRVLHSLLYEAMVFLASISIKSLVILLYKTILGCSLQVSTIFWLKFQSLLLIFSENWLAFVGTWAVLKTDWVLITLASTSELSPLILVLRESHIGRLLSLVKHLLQLLKDLLLCHVWLILLRNVWLYDSTFFLLHRWILLTLVVVRLLLLSTLMMRWVVSILAWLLFLGPTYWAMCFMSTGACLLGLWALKLKVLIGALLYDATTSTARILLTNVAWSKARLPFHQTAVIS